MNSCRSILLTIVCMGIAVHAADQPNIIYLFTDQQHADMMSCAGNTDLKTPAMDYIAENGIRFTRAYTSNPVCAPARVSLMTGRFPGYFKSKTGQQARNNGGAVRITVSDEVRQTTLGAFMQKSGYALYFGGKRHLPSALNPQETGFNYFSKNERGELAAEAAKIIQQPHEKPYFMVVSLINPHDICYMAINADPSSSERYQRAKTEQRTLKTAMTLPDGMSEETFYKTICPKLPDNFELQDDEPKAIGSLLKRRSFRTHARETWDEKQWRMHRYAYARLTELVDSEIQVILDALKETGQEENTLILFSSDHGDMDSSHRMEHKSALYEQSANIPFMVMWKGHIKPGQVDTVHLISNGLDILPTVCDYAGVKAVTDPRGRSLRPLLEGNTTDWRKTLGVESEIGRMVVSEDKLKYIKYDAVGTEINLLDLKHDPGEMRHFTNDPEYAERLKTLEKSFETEWFPGF